MDAYLFRGTAAELQRTYNVLHRPRTLEDSLEEVPFEIPNRGFRNQYSNSCRKSNFRIQDSYQLKLTESTYHRIRKMQKLTLP